MFKKSSNFRPQKLIHDLRKPISNTFMLISADLTDLNQELLSYLNTLIDQSKLKLPELKNLQSEHSSSLCDFTDTIYKEIETLIKSDISELNQEEVKKAFKIHLEEFDRLSKLILLDK